MKKINIGDKMKTKLKFIVVPVFCFLLSSRVSAQVKIDSLSLNEAIKMTLASSNSLQQASYAVDASLAKVEQSKSSLYPEANVSLNYTWIGPIPAFSFPGFGNISLAPDNNWDEHVTVSTTLYDFNKRDKNIEFAKSQVNGFKDKVEFIKQDLVYKTVQSFYTIIFLKQSIEVQKDQINTFNKHLEWTKKKFDAGTATDFDMLTVKVRIASAENSKISLENSLANTEIYLRRLLGVGPSTAVNPQGQFTDAPAKINYDSLIYFAYANRVEIKNAENQKAAAKAMDEVAANINNPSLMLIFNYGFKNGYEPNMFVWRGNFALTAAAQIPVSKFIPFFGGNKEENMHQEAVANMNAADSYKKDMTDQIKAEIQKAISDIKSSIEKYRTTEASIKQAESALNLAKIRYDAGSVTNLDLLDAETSLSQAKLMRLEALYRYMLGIYELKQAAGEKIW